MMELIQIRVKIQPLISLVVFLLAACGSDSGTGSGVAQAETVYGLGECEKSNEGVIKLVTSENQYYKCVDGDWEVTEAPVQSSPSKKNSFAGSSSSNKIFPGLDTKSSASYEFLSMDSESEYDPVKQTLKDLRDGQIYRTTKIGNQVWMAENLNYRYLGPTAELDSSSFCYNDNPANCIKYGRLYLWSAAMDSAGIIKGNTANGCGFSSECSSSGTVRGVCPEGWHVPGYSEWKTLIDAVDGPITGYDYSDNMAGSKLKSSNGWNSNCNGTDNYSFSALPAGSGDDSRFFDYEGNVANFWSSTATKIDRSTAYYIFLHYCDVNAYLSSDGYKYKGFSIRCLKD